MILKPLDRKLLRDLSQMKSQLLAIALVLASGVAVFVSMRTTLRALERARDGYFARQRFPDVFASCRRAPRSLASHLLEIDGVERCQTRVVADVTLDVPGMTEAALGRLVSLPEHGRPELNDLVLRRGRMPARDDEVLINEAFDEAHSFALGVRLGAVLNGAWKTFRVVGTALSPEFTYALPPGQLLPDNRRFGVLWVRRTALGPALDMEGAFNDVALSVGRGASVEAVRRQVDALLARYGGTGAIARKDHPTAFFLDNELTQLQTFALMIPALFLLVTAFLLNIVFGRVISNQREQIAMLKAVGYRDVEIGGHYARMVGLVVLAGVAAGIGAGAWLAAALVRMYLDYYRFPELPFSVHPADALVGLGIAAGAAALGTWASIRRTVRLPPAEAMRPPAPPSYRPTLLERVGLSRLLPVSVRMVLRELERRPLRAVMSTVGIALACALTVVNAFTMDSIRHLLGVQFGLIQREDVRVHLFEPRAPGVLSDLQHLPGVLRVEPFRSAPVRLWSGNRRRQVSILGMPEGATLHALVNTDLQTIVPPEQGLVLSTKLADILEVAPGDAVTVEVLEGQRRTRQVPVTRTTETYMGLSATMSWPALCRLLGEGPNLNGAWLLVDDDRLPELHAAVKRTPVIAGISVRDSVLREVRHMLDENLGRWVTISLSFSLVMAFGVLYNAVRVTLAERQHELASLRVLGFRRAEVGRILVGEIALLTAVGTPLGLWLGRGLAMLLASSPGYDNEQFRLPMVISPATYALAAVTVVGAAAISSYSAWRRLEAVDIVAVLKSRD